MTGDTQRSDRSRATALESLCAMYKRPAFIIDGRAAFYTDVWAQFKVVTE